MKLDTQMAGLKNNWLDKQEHKEDPYISISTYAHKIKATDADIKIMVQALKEMKQILKELK